MRLQVKKDGWWDDKKAKPKTTMVSLPLIWPGSPWAMKSFQLTLVCISYLAVIWPGSPWAMKSLQLSSFCISQLSRPKATKSEPKWCKVSKSEATQIQVRQSKATWIQVRQSDAMRIQARQSEVKAHKAKTKRAKVRQSEPKWAKAKQNSLWQSIAAESKGKRSVHTSRAVTEHGPAQKWLSGDKAARCC